MSFESLGLSPELVRAVHEQGYAIPTPVQHEAIPLVLAGRDLLARAQTGTGKTAAFALPILERLKAQQNRSFSPARHPVRALVLTPTRELAVQVAASFRVYGRHLLLRTATVYGGTEIGAQTRELQAGVEVVVATPGRLLDHLGQRNVSLGQVEVLVLDEADRMLDMGFIDDIRRILATLPARRQNLLFSATLSPDVRRLADAFLTNPATVDVSPPSTAADSIEQVVYLTDDAHKRELLAELIRERDLRQVLVFVNRKLTAGRLASWLDRDGIEADAIHGDRSQGQREATLDAFKRGELRVLVATDVAARGLDIAGLPQVVNFELPFDPEDYVHRIGRTGRAGLTGQAISIAAWHEEDALKGINRLIRRDLPVRVFPGFEPDPDARHDPVHRASGRRTGYEHGTRTDRRPRTPVHGRRVWRGSPATAAR